ncbi:MAG: hypothetical protein IT364_24750 [Candidatus Hydrogenedentes bacterium]|nr:hypothetical protein [Candidatus Hydrogenedentota bacterium]
MVKLLTAAMLGVLVLAQQPQGTVSQSELGAPGQPAPAAPAPPAAPPAQTPKASAQPAPAAPAAAQPQERDRVQSNKPVAAFWTVIPGR